MPIDWLLAWGVTQAAGALVKPVLEDFAKDVVKDGAKDYVKRCFGNVFSAAHQDALQQAVGKALAELLQLIEAEILDADYDPAAWKQDAKQFVRSESVITALRELFTTSATQISADVLRSGWQKSPGTDLLPPEFDWSRIAKRFSRAVRNLREQDSELRAVLQTQALVETADATKRLAHLPPEFNLDGYRESLLEYHGHLKLELLDSAGAYHRVKLWSVFVAQTVRDCQGYVPQYLEIPKEVQTQLRQQGEGDNELDRHSEEMLNERRALYQDRLPRSVLEVVNEDRYSNLVILGDPGAGKSTLLKAVALEWARIENRDDRHAARLPLLIELNAYSQWPCVSGKSFVRYLQGAQTIHRLDQFRLDERLRQRDGAVLLLDGLDEIFDLPQRKAVLNDIHRFSNEYPQTRIIVTSRVIGYDQRQLADAGFHHFMLQDLDKAQIIEFLTNWYATFVSDGFERTTKQDRLRRAIVESRPIRELAENPLLLTMMAILNLHQELPRDRVKLYERATEVLLHQWDFERLGLASVLEYREKAEMLRRLAYHMQNAPEGLRGNIIDGDTLRQIFREYLSNELKLPKAYETTNELLKDLRHRNFIICHIGGDYYAFVHRAFLEYFCASALVRYALTKPYSLDYLRNEVFANHWHEKTWHEVLCLIAGMEDQVPFQHVAAIVDFLLEQKDERHSYQNVFLAADCSIEVRNPKSLGNSRLNCSEALINLTKTDFLDHLDFFYTYGTWEKAEKRAQELYSKAINRLANPLLFDEAREWLIESSEDHKNWFVKQLALRKLSQGWKEDPTTFDIVKFRANQSSSASVRSAALERLARDFKQDREAFTILKDRAENDLDRNVRCVALQEIAQGWRDDTQVLPWLKLRAEQDTDYLVEATIVREIASGWKDLPETLLWVKAHARGDSYTDVRSAALQELVKHWKNDPDVLEFIREYAVNDVDPSIRRMVKHLLSGMEMKDEM